MHEHQILSTYAASMFALLNPLGMLPVFIGYSAGLTAGVQRWLAALVSVTVLALLLLFLLTGPSILHFFGISIDAFRMAGGILLLLIGIRIVTGEGGAQSRAWHALCARSCEITLWQRSPSDVVHSGVAFVHL